MSVRVDIAPELLAWARERSRIEPAEFATRFPKYESWVAGAAMPTLKQLETFARRTHTPFGYFFLDRPPVEHVPIPDFRTVADRAILLPSADLLDTIYACQTRQEWYRDHQLMNREAPLDFVGSLTADTPTGLAANVLRKGLAWSTEDRDRLKSSEKTFSTLRNRAEAIGILVMVSGIVGSNTHRKLNPEEFRGFALADPNASIVFVNGADTKAAQLFTLAHELAHVWLGQSGLSDLDPKSDQRYRQERWCSQVAAELLVPMSEFRSAFDATEELRRQLKPLAALFRVSTEVILGRIREVGHISWEQYLEELEKERREQNKSTSKRGGGGDFYSTKPVQVSTRFCSWGHFKCTVGKDPLHKGTEAPRRTKGIDHARPRGPSRSIVVAYLLDTDVFIRAKNDHYGFDICPGFWDWLIGANADGVVQSVEAVYNEIVAGRDDLSEWARAHRSIFLPLTAGEIRSVAAVNRWANDSPDYDPAAKAEFADAADSLLIAQAMAGGHTVVTHERISDARRRIPIPNAAMANGVQCISPFAMLRREAAVFVLG